MHIGYCDLHALHTSLDYSEGSKKNLFAMIIQLGPPAFFVTLIIGEVFNYFSNTKFQNCRSEHDHGLIWIKIALIYKVNINEEIEVS